MTPTLEFLIEFHHDIEGVVEFGEAAKADMLIFWWEQS